MPLIDRTGDHQCVVCGRAAGDYVLWPRGKTPGFTCSHECAYLANWVREASVRELSDLERQALDKASDLAGEYLDGLGKTDLAELDLEEWRTLLGKIVQGFSTGLKGAMQKQSRVAPPY